jgi:hypothetical protein
MIMPQGQCDQLLPKFRPINVQLQYRSSLLFLDSQIAGRQASLIYNQQVPNVKQQASHPRVFP